ncbi:MAG: single-stranded DNA-binding protein [Candidatus Margulisiibacteriota bacterium]
MQYNKVFLIGNLTRDPEMRYTTAGIAVTHFTVAVNRFGRGGEEKSAAQEVDFINVVAWRRLAEICGEYLKKGSPVAVEGRLQIRSYDGKNGEKRTMTEVVVDNLQMLGRKTAPGAAPQTGVPQAETAGEPVAEDEIPF